MEAMLSIEQVAAKLGVSTVTVRAWVAKGKLPEPEVISPVCRRWREGVISAAIAEIRRERGLLPCDVELVGKAIETFLGGAMSCETVYKGRKYKVVKVVDED